MTTNIGVDFVANTASWDAGVKHAADTLKQQSAQMSGALTKLDGDMAGFGRTSVQAAGQTQQIQSAMRNLVAVQIQAKSTQAELRTAYRNGSIGLEEYKLRQLEVSTAVRLARGEYSQSLATIGRTGQVAGGSSMAFRQMGFQLSDVAVQFASGTRAAVIFAQQGPQIVQAMTMASGSAKGFAGFMGGPWGALILTGVSVVGALVAVMGRSSDEAEKAKKAHMSLGDAIRALGTDTKEATKAIEDYNAAQKQSRDNAAINIKLDLEAAKAKLDQARATRELLKAELEREQARASIAPTPGLAGEKLEAYQAGVAANVSAIQAKIAANEASMQGLGQAVLNLRIQDAVRDAKAAADPLQAINDKYDDLRDAAIAAAAANDKLSKSLKGTLAGFELARKAALDNAKALNSDTGAASSLGDMVALVKDLFGPGTRITSRTNHSRFVAGTNRVSDHAVGRAIDFVPPGGMGQFSKAQVHQMLIDAGVDIRRNAQGVEQFFGPGDPGHANHFHVAFQGTASPERAQRLREQMEEKALRAREEAIRHQKAFDDASAQLDDQLLAFKQANANSIDEQAGLAKQQIQIENDKYVADVQAKEKLGEYTELQGTELIVKRAILSALQAQRVVQEAAQKKAQDALDIQLAANDNEKDLLAAQENVAQTSTERRAIQLKLLDLDQQEERLRLQNIVNIGTMVGATAEQAKAAQIAADRLKALPGIYGARQQGVINSTAGPLEAYLNSIPKTADQINLKVEGLMVDELEAVRRGIDDAITNALGIKDPMLAGLIDLFIQEVLIRPIADALNKARASSGGGFGGFFTSILGAFGIGGGGGVAGINYAADVANVLPMNFDSGGYTGDGHKMQIAGLVHKGEFVFDQDAVRKIGLGNLEAFRRGGFAAVKPRMPRFNLPPLPIHANNNGQAAGDTHFHLSGVMSKRQARETVEQLAAAQRRKVGMNARRGLAG